MEKRIYISILAFSLSIYSFARINVDSLFQKISRLSFYCVPTLAYQPETKFAFGVGGGYYFKFINPSKISSLTFNTSVTQNQQFTFNVTPRIYFGNKTWYVYSNLNIQNYPDTYYGIGNAKEDLLTHPIRYTSRRFSLTLLPQRYLTEHLSLGILLSVKSEKTVWADSLNKRMLTTNVLGWKPYLMVGLGCALTYDSRNSLFYPTTGVFSKLNFIRYDRFWGSSYNVTDLRFDFRHYISLYQNHVFAWQFYTNWKLGCAIPFQMLATIGGSDLMRGFTQEKYRDNALAVLQGEYRFPIYNIFKGAVFCSTGDVFDSRNLIIDKLKFSYGAGVRFRITKAKVNLRFDVTLNNYYSGFNYYITAMEAF